MTISATTKFRDYVSAEIAKIKGSRLAQNAGWMLAGQGMGLLLQAGYFVLLARLLGVKEYGVYAGAFALTSIAAVFSTFGSGTLLLRYVSSDPKRFSVYWGNTLAVTALMSLLLVGLLAILTPHIMDRSTLPVVILVAVGNCFCSQLTVCAGQVFQAFEQLKATAAFNLLTNFLRTIAVIVLVTSFHHVHALQWAIASLIASFIALTAAITVVTIKFGRPVFVPKLWFANAAEGFGYSFASSTSSAYNDLDKTMLSHYGMNAANGIYSMAYRVVDIATIPILAVRDAAMPKFFKSGSFSVSAVEQLSAKLVKRVMPVAILGAVFTFFIAPLIPRVVGHGFDQSVSAVRWLCWIPILRVVHQISGSALAGAGVQRYRTATQLTAALLNFTLNLWFIPRFGWIGAAWTSLITDGVLSALNWTILHRVGQRASAPLIYSSVPS